MVDGGWGFNESFNEIRGIAGVFNPLSIFLIVVILTENFMEVGFLCLASY